jgi:pimeloyl-ACP methyl ester carboxylesterase
MLRRIAHVVLSMLAGVVLLLATVRATAPRFVFPTFRVERARATAPDATRRIVRSRDGVPVEVLSFPGPPGAPVIVHFHTNRQTIADSLWLARSLRRHGLGAVLVEYRGYGTVAATSPTETGLYDDAEAALDDLAARGIARSQIVLLGNSLGTGVAAEMARRDRARALVLVAPFTSIPDVVEDSVPLVPAQLLVADAFDTLAKASEIRVPTLIVHGDSDEIVPFWMGERLAATFARARLLRVVGGHHGDVLVQARERVVDEIVAWVVGSVRPPLST